MVCICSSGAVLVRWEVERESPGLWRANLPSVLTARWGLTDAHLPITPIISVSQEYAPCHWSRIRLCTEVLVIQRGFTRGASALKLVMFCCFSVEGSVSGVLSRGPEVIWEVSMWMKPDANQTNPFKIKTNVSWRVSYVCILKILRAEPLGGTRGLHIWDQPQHYLSYIMNGTWHSQVLRKLMW